MTNKLIELFGQMEVMQEAVYNRKENISGLSLTGLADVQKVCFLATLATKLEEGPLIFLVSKRDDIRAYRRDLGVFVQNIPMLELYPGDLLRTTVDTKNHEVLAERIMAFQTMRSTKPGIVFVTAESLMQKVPSVEALSEQKLIIKSGRIIEQNSILQTLVEYGYERTEKVETIGQFALRGDIMDIFPINLENPVRVEWFDCEIDVLKIFNVEDQRSISNLKEVPILPLILKEDSIESSCFDYFSKTSQVIIDEPLALFETVRNLRKESLDYIDEIFTAEELIVSCKKNNYIEVSNFGSAIFPDYEKLAVPIRPVINYNKNTEILVKDLVNYIKGGITPFIIMTTKEKALGLADSLQQNGVKSYYAGSLDQKIETPKKATVFVYEGELSSGFRPWDENWLVLTEKDIFGMQKRKRFNKKNAGAQLKYFTDIKDGDYVVHEIHGIARYEGVENIMVDDKHRDYLLLRYAKEDKLYVPIEQVNLLHKYIGSEGRAPRLSRMGGSDWNRSKKKAKTAITELATELLRLAAQREITEGYAFAPDNEFQVQFEASFPFEETPDQLKTIAEIKADMEKPVPMERLLCGDVGYGKTEVAMRAAFKAVMDGKQVAVLVPTTVLAQQHFSTFTQRMQAFGVNVEMLSRFRNRSEQRVTIERLKAGNVDIIIGTHRIIQSDIEFPNLGLLIIDEEQRFGVAQKEKLKKWSNSIDVLTLSATPIPRTLHMALVNGRDMSVIETPPEERLPVETYVAEYNDGMIKEAVEREIRRGGRVFYVHNRVQGLLAIAEKLRKIVPGAKIKIAHGQMGEDMLEDAIIGFYEGKFDVLLCTTIIENGLDIPLANTIIIDGADYFGLSQLYQMRGRVGRQSRLAYAYFVYKKNKTLNEVAAKRLKAIRDFTELGAGFKIAMRDLEIRGAGNILGAEQHGHIAGVGFATYCDMLEKTILSMKNGSPEGKIEPDPIIELDVEAYIPDEYIAMPRYKMELYRRFAELLYEDKNELLDEILDRFGDVPEEVNNLWRLAVLRSLCRKLKIRGIAGKGAEIKISFSPNTIVDPDAILNLLERYKKSSRYSNYDGKQQIIFKRNRIDEEVIEWLEKEIPKLIGDL